MRVMGTAPIPVVLLMAKLTLLIEVEFWLSPVCQVWDLRAEMLPREIDEVQFLINSAGNIRNKIPGLSLCSPRLYMI